jgi:deoxycytidine triphosphate deaminase
MILAKNLKNRGVDIAPLENDTKEQVSVDLTIGEMYQRSGEPDWRNIEAEVVLHPRSCILIQTKEVLKMPNNVFGLLATKGGMAAKGVIIANTKLDPLFDGHLNIPVFNVSGRRVTLKKGQKFCSISFWNTESPVVGNTTRNAIKIQPRDGNPFVDFITHNAAHIITAAASITGSIVAAVITIKFGK